MQELTVAHLDQHLVSKLIKDDTVDIRLNSNLNVPVNKIHIPKYDSSYMEILANKHS